MEAPWEGRRPGGIAHPSTDPEAHSLTEAAANFRQRLGAIKAAINPSFPWYPYDTLANFAHLAPFFATHDLASLAGDGNILDIGAADGDTAFFLESLGYKAGIVDHGPTNYNTLRGAHLVRDKLQSCVTIDDVDLDSTFVLPGSNINLVFFLGILYHLKNPFYVLEQLATAHAMPSSARASRASPPPASQSPESLPPICSIPTNPITTPRISGFLPKPACAGSSPAADGRSWPTAPWATRSIQIRHEATAMSAPSRCFVRHACDDRLSKWAPHAEPRLGGTCRPPQTPRRHLGKCGDGQVFWGWSSPPSACLAGLGIRRSCHPRVPRAAANCRSKSSAQRVRAINSP
jgi:hypothetical protein